MMSDVVDLSEYEQGKIVQEVVELRRRTWFRKMKPGHVLIGGRALGDKIIQCGDIFTEAWDRIYIREEQRLLLTNHRKVFLSVIEIQKYKKSLMFLDPKSNMYVAMMLAGEGVDLINPPSILIGTPRASEKSQGSG